MLDFMFAEVTEWPWWMWAFVIVVLLSAVFTVVGGPIARVCPHCRKRMPATHRRCRFCEAPV